MMTVGWGGRRREETFCGYSILPVWKGSGGEGGMMSMVRSI